MKQYIKNQRIALAIVAYVLVLGGIFFGGINFLVAKIHEVNNQMQTQKLDRETQSQQINDIPKMQQQFDDIESQKAIIEGMFLNKDDAVALIEKLEGLAEQCGVGVKIAVDDKQDDLKKKPAATKASKDAPEVVALQDLLPGNNFLKFTLVLSGGYDGITKFISRIENMGYYNDVTSLDIKKNLETNNPVVSSGMSGIFGSAPVNNSNASGTKVSADSQGDLAATLSVVFYIK